MTPFRVIKNTIRRCRTPDEPANAGDVKDILANHDRHDGQALLESYERAKRHGEIYQYPSDDEEIVKITDEVLAE